MATKKSGKTNKTAHVLNVLAGAGHDEAPETPLEEKQPVQQRRPARPHTLEMANADDEALAQAIRDSLQTMENIQLDMPEAASESPTQEPEPTMPPVMGEEKLMANEPERVEEMLPPPPAPEPAPPPPPPPAPEPAPPPPPPPPPEPAPPPPAPEPAPPPPPPPEPAPPPPPPPPAPEPAPPPPPPPAPAPAPPPPPPAPEVLPNASQTSEILLPGTSLDVGYVNIMQALVEEKAQKYMEMFKLCTCSRCIADVKALALTNLPAKYAVMEKSDAIPMLTVYEGRFSSVITAQLLKACEKVMGQPRHE